MSTEWRYALPVDQTDWVVNGQTQTVLRWEYEDGRDSLLKLYDKGKKNQWDAADRIDSMPAAAAFSLLSPAASRFPVRHAD